MLRTHDLSHQCWSALPDIIHRVHHAHRRSVVSVGQSVGERQRRMDVTHRHDPSNSGADSARTRPAQQAAASPTVAHHDSALGRVLSASAARPRSIASAPERAGSRTSSWSPPPKLREPAPDTPLGQLACGGSCRRAGCRRVGHRGAHADRTPRKGRPRTDDRRVMNEMTSYLMHQLPRRFIH